MNWSDKTILVTGGTGFFGNKFIEVMLKKYQPETIRIFSRDELKHHQMMRKFNNDKRLRFFIGDVRDKDRLSRAMDGADIVVHAAALKNVPLCEYNPFEAVKTNVLGAENVIDTAISHNVERVIAISTDKAVNPANLYGATKMCMEKLFVSGNSYVGQEHQTKLSCTRYCNVIGSSGSVVPLFEEQKTKGIITVTDKRMTRFWITSRQAVDFVIKCTETMHGGEVFVPKVPSMKLLDLAKTIAPDCKIEYLGIRPGEKIHECLLTEDEARHALEFEDFFVVAPEDPSWPFESWKNGKALKEGFRYSSDTNDRWLTKEELLKVMKEL